jgi:hypothetical protein
MAIGDQDHGRVAMPVAAMLAGAVHQPLDIALGEIASLDCQVFDVWCAFYGCRFHADKPCLRGTDCLAYTPLLNSQTQWRSYRLGRPKIDRVTERKVRRQLAKGVGILKVAKSLGIGTGTVQRISKERAMSLRGAQQ